MPTPVGEQPRRDDEGRWPGPDRVRRPHSYPQEPGTEALTVEQLIARTGASSTVGRRRASHSASAPGGAQQPREAPAVSARPGFPPVPPSERPGRRATHSRWADQATPRGGLPPVPGATQRDRWPDALPEQPQEQPWPVVPERSGIRHSTPLPPLPGRRPEKREPRSRPPRAPRSPARRRLLRAVVVVVLAVALVALYHLGLYFYVDRSIDRVNALATNGPEILAPQLQAAAQNYLVVGTGVPGEHGPASVATLVVSISGDQSRAVLLSVPPTALVDTPECRTRDGALRGPTSEAFAASLLDGGPSCLVRSVQQLSGLRIDHYLGVDLGRLPGMVDALGGVAVCVVPSPALTAAAHPLPTGSSRLSGTAATGYLRPGSPTADVTGASVAERAQLLLTSTLRAAMSRHTLLNTLTLTRFLTRASGALTVDNGTTLGDLRSLATSLGRLSGSAVQRASLPVAQEKYTPVGTKQEYVLLDHTATRSVFDSVIAHTRLPKDIQPGAPPSDGGAGAGDGAGDAAPSPAPPSPAPAPAPQGPTVPPNQISVDVLNGTGVNGLAGTVANALKGQGFAVGSVGNEPGAVTQTLVRYGPGAADKARTVAAAVPGSVLQADDGLGAAVQLVIGPGHSNVVPVQLATAAPASASAAAPTTTPPKPVTC